MEEDLPYGLVKQVSPLRFAPVEMTRSGGLVKERSVRDELVARWRELTERVLPERARAERWPLRLDHCFKRVCLDWACHGVWYEHSPRPAEQRMPYELFRRAVAGAEELAEGGVELLRERNRASLRWRGKLGADEGCAAPAGRATHIQEETGKRRRKRDDG